MLFKEEGCLKIMVKERTEKILKLILALAFPFLLGVIYCLIRGISIGDLYLPASYNNDCVFYYKLVDSIVNKGWPTGFFGFNESHALIGGFAAWSPLLVMPWALWGVVFGWSYSAVIWCNLVLFAVAFAYFVYLADLDFKRLAALFIAFLLFPSFSIHLMNVLPEIIVGALTFVYLGFAIRSANRGPKVSYVIVMYVIAGYLTITRPYMILFMILPTFYLAKLTKKTIAAVILIGVAAVSMFGNVLIGHYLTAPYFEPLFKMDIVKELLAGHFSYSFWMAVDAFKSMSAEMLDAFRGAFSYGLTMGTQYVVAIAAAIVSIIIALRKGENKLRAICIFYAVSVAALLLAIVFFLRKVNEGGRHIWVFAIIGIVIVCVCRFDKLGVVLKSSLAILLVVFCIRGAMVPTDYDIPMPSKTAEDNVNYWQDIFGNEAIFKPNAKGYDNTVAWVFWDSIGGKTAVTEYSELYALPAGMGISCCYPEYVINNFDGLQSRYIITVADGEVSKLCESKGLKVVGRHENVIMYQRY